MVPEWSFCGPEAHFGVRLGSIGRLDGLTQAPSDPMFTSLRSQRYAISCKRKFFLFLQDLTTVDQPCVMHCFCSGSPSREERRLIPLVRGGVRKSATVRYTHTYGCFALACPFCVESGECKRGVRAHPGLDHLRGWSQPAWAHSVLG